MVVVQDPIASSLLESFDHFPDKVWVLKTSDDRYGCFHYEKVGVHGLAVFAAADAANDWGAALLPNPATFTAKELAFDEAREVALGRPVMLSALFLLDDPTAIQTHWLR